MISLLEMSYLFVFFTFDLTSETVFKEKHGVLDPMHEFTITSPYVDFTSPESTPTHVPWGIGKPDARVGFIPQSGTKNLVPANFHIFN
jgi:hypothetical protein